MRLKTKSKNQKTSSARTVLCERQADQLPRGRHAASKQTPARWLLTACFVKRRRKGRITNKSSAFFFLELNPPKNKVAVFVVPLATRAFAHKTRRIHGKECKRRERPAIPRTNLKVQLFFGPGDHYIELSRHVSGTGPNLRCPLTRLISWQRQQHVTKSVKKFADMNCLLPTHPPPPPQKKGGLPSLPSHALRLTAVN